jgi:hypothetical protein
MPGTNITMLQKVANGLGDLNESVVYVGGSVAELYVTDTAATEVRPTVDIDCVVELASYKNFYELEDILRKKKFRNDTTSGAPICRWLYNGVSVDIMPNDEKIIGFTNKWYKCGTCEGDSRTKTCSNTCNGNPCHHTRKRERLGGYA